MSSTERLDRLSPEQLKTLEQTREEWRGYGLGAGPTDRVAAEAAMRQAYQAAGLKPPQLIVWLGSPWAGNTAARLLDSYIDWPHHLNTAQIDVWDAVWKQCVKQVETRLGAEKWSAARKQLRREADEKVLKREGVLLEKYVRDQFAENMGIFIWKQLRDMAGVSMSRRLREQVEDNVKIEVDSRLSPVVSEQLYHELVQPIHLQAWSYVAEPLKQRVPTMTGMLAGPQRWDCLYGQHDAGWLSYYAFLQKMGMDEFVAPLQGLMGMARHAGWFWPMENLCIMTERPLALKRDNRFRIHAETDMCLRYSDDWGLYAWHGVLVPPYVILLPEPLTFDLIESEPNAEVRRVLIERFGLENYLREGKVLRIHQDEAGILYRMNLESDEPILVVRVKNSTPEPDGSIKEYFLRVPPNMQRAKQAVAWTFGLTEEEYNPLIET